MYTIRQQIQCVDREIAYRKMCYPKWVKAKRMTQAKADDEIDCMESIKKSLLMMPQNSAIVGHDGVYLHVSIPDQNRR